MKATKNIAITTQEQLVNEGGVMQAGGDIKLTSTKGDIVNTARQSQRQKDENNYRWTAFRGSITALGSSILNAFQDIVVTGSELLGQKRTTLLAQHNINIEAASQEIKSVARGKQGYKKEHVITHDPSVVIASGPIDITAGNSITWSGSQLQTTGDAMLTAGKDITLATVKDYYNYEAQYRKKSLTRKSNRLEQRLEESNRPSLMQSQGKTVLTAGGNIAVQGSQIHTAKNLALTAGNNIKVAAVQDKAHIK